MFVSHPEQNSLIRNMLKTVTLFLVIGLAVSVTAPPLFAALAGLHIFGTALSSAMAAYGTISLGNSISTALVFSSFGAINTLLQPVFGAVFDKKENIPDVQPRELISGSKERGLAPATEKQCEPEQQPEAKFCPKFDAVRSTPAAQMQRC